MDKGMVKKFIFIFGIGIFVAFLGAVFYGYVLFKKTEDIKGLSLLQGANFEGSESIFLEPKVLGIETQGSGDMAVSENFKLKQISFGGNVALSDGTRNDNLIVSDVRSEMLMTKSQQEYKFLITWKTNKLATSEVNYSNANTQGRSMKENGYGIVHSAVLSGLEPASAYTYFIKTQDQWGNIVQSDKYGMYTSQKTLSIFELISREFSRMFGWALKK